jgi:hypothetical protein
MPAHNMPFLAGAIACRLCVVLFLVCPVGVLPELEATGCGVASGDLGHVLKGRIEDVWGRVGCPRFAL